MGKLYRTKAKTTEYFLEYFLEHCIVAVAFFLPLSLDISSVFLSLASILWLGKIIVARRLNFKRTPLDIPVCLLVIFSAASIYSSPDRSFSFYNYYHLMGRYILLYYLVINNVSTLAQVKRLVWAMLVSAAMVALYGYYQYFFGLKSSAVEWVDKDQFPDLKLRVFSTLKNPNILAGYLVTMIAMGAGMGAKTKSGKTQVILWGLLGLLGGCLLLTYSRGAWVSLLAVMGVYGILCNRRVLWLLVLVPVLMFFAHDAVTERVMSIMNPTDTSSTLRLALWESTLAMIADNPFFGIGWGSYWIVYPDYDFFVHNVHTKIFHAHNMYLNIAAEIGIPGFLAFLAVLYGHIRIALTALKATSDEELGGILLGLVAAMGGIIINGFTDYVLFNIQLSMSFWLLNALIVIIGEQLHTRRQIHTPIKKVINF